MEASERICPPIIFQLKESIEDAGFQEVLAVGRLEEDGLVSSIVVAARGSDMEVPALTPFMEKGDVVIHNHPSGVLKPSAADLQVASRLGNQGIGFFIVDNEVSRVYVVAEPVEKKKLVPLDIGRLESVLMPGGSLERIYPGYEVRETQIEMLRKVARNFNENGICVAEGGTGVGKSLAYLLPAFAWAEENDERIVISTATINLQQQLVYKDIPLVRKILPSRISAALVKGRGNYLCLKRLEDALQETALFQDDDTELLRLKQWCESTSTGSRSDLSFLPEENVWQRVRSETDACLGLRCRFREQCFVLKARKEASSAQILIANHHLLFSDLSMRLSGLGFDGTAVLPPFHRIVFDEAHNMEHCATSYFSEEISSIALKKQLSRLFHNRKGRNIGLLIGLQQITGQNTPTRKVPVLIESTLKQMDALDSRSEVIVGEQGNLRFTPGMDREVADSVLDFMRDLQKLLIDLVDTLHEALGSLTPEDAELPVPFETRLVVHRLEGLASVLERFCRFEERKDEVVWMTRVVVPQGRYIRYVITPLDLSRLMRESVFEPYKTVVCTSATLTVNQDFTFWRSRIGLHDHSDERLDLAMFLSPFPYKEHVLLGIPGNAPFPNEADYQDFINNGISRILELSEGKGLILFTSYEMLTRTYNYVKPLLAENGIVVFRQGDDERSRLLKSFQEDTGSVLFATYSFWEGIDVPGESLKVVVICRLPFRVPTDPVHMARLEAIEKQGGNPFVELSLPEAVMKLKQGFGRLMRRTTDRGVVFILDSRVVRKQYGSAFIASLPETMVCIKDMDSLLLEVENFLYP